MPIKVLAFDGDDTLWHNETRFNVTQGELRELVRRHVPDADVDSHLFDVEMRNLGLYGYGVKAFTLSMLETAIQLTDGRIPATDLQVILGWGKRMLTAPTELLDGVAEALRDASTRYSLLLITKGDLFDQETKLAQSGLGDLFAGVEILSDKTAGTYASLLKRRGIEPAEFVMVGNSLRSDVAPVVEVGARAVHIPYHVTWSHEHLPDGVLPPSGWYRLNGLSELGALLESIDQPPA
ncbi:MAG: HAD family hydrolase [Candidatus Dormiibacterota bacterium]